MLQVSNKNSRTRSTTIFLFLTLKGYLFTEVNYIFMKTNFVVNANSILFQRWRLRCQLCWQYDVDLTLTSSRPTSRHYFNIYQRLTNVGCLLCSSHWYWFLPPESIKILTVLKMKWNAQCIKWVNWTSIFKWKYSECKGYVIFAFL